MEILAAMPEGLCICAGADEQGKIVYVNQPMADILSGEIADIIGQPFAQCFGKFLHNDYLADRLDTVLRDGTYQTLQVENHRAGHLAWLGLTFIPLGRYFVCRIDNLSEQKISEMQLVQAQKLEALGQLAGGVAHDFNNILSIIDGYARIARKAAKDDEEVSAHIDNIRQSVRRGAALTGKLLSFGRGSLVVESTIDLSRLVTDYECFLKPLLDASVNLHINAPDEVAVDCPPDDISQIIMNLAINARDAMPEGGDLNITVDMCEAAPGKPATGKGYARLRISDAGTGMSEDIKKRIFDPFFTTKQPGQGTGLGLSMVYGMVEKMKGSIEVDSAPGEGTTFTIYLPVSGGQPMRQIVETTDEEGNVSLRLDGYTALVAEDEPVLLEMVSTMLGNMGMEVIQAANGNEALARQDDYDGTIDFLVTDVVMPEMNGVRLSEMFSSVRPDSKTIFISGYPAHSQMARISLPEGACLLSKPVAYNNLIYLLRTMVSDEKEGGSGLSRLAGDWEDDDSDAAEGGM